MISIDELRWSIIKDILFNVFFVLATIPIWLTFNVSTLESTAKYYDNYDYISYNELNNPYYTFSKMTDDDGLRNVETKDIVVFNNSNTSDNYNLVLKVEKNNNNNLSDVRINVNYNVSDLNSYSSYEDDNNYYFVLDSRSISATEKKYNISMWNSLESNYDNNLNYEFLITKDSEI